MHMQRALLASSILLFALPAIAQPTPEEIKAIWHKLPRPRMAVAPTKDAPILDGEIGRGEWGAASAVTDFIGSGSPKWKGVAGYDLVSAQTRVHVTHDAKALYVAFHCDEPEIETLQVTDDVRRDGSLWRDDCVELQIAPPGATHYFHVIVNSKGWVYDAKVAPGKKPDKAWNAAGLTAAAAVSKPGKGSHWSAEIALPFAALHAAAPKLGDVWRVNFARERYAASYRAVMEYSTWSGLVGGFGQPEMFGELCFCGLRQDIRLPRVFLGVWPLRGTLGDPTARRAVTLNIQSASRDGVTSAARGPRDPVRLARETELADRVHVATEGTQLLALTVVEQATRKVLSVTRAPFHVPDALARGRRAVDRLRKLAAKATPGSQFARGVQAERDALTPRIARAGPLLKTPGEDVHATRRQWEAFDKRVAQAEAATTFIVWTRSPYIATGPASMPDSFGPPPTLAIAAAQNEYANVVVNVTNLTDEDMEFSLQGRLPDQVGRARSSLCATVQQLARYQPKFLGRKLSDLPEKADGLAMPLVELNGLSTFFVRPYCTRQLWLTVHTRTVKPGRKRGSLRLVPISTKLPPVAVPWEITVWPVKIADDAPIGVFCFDYAGDYEWMKTYKINTWFRGAFVSKLALGPQGNLAPYKTDIGRVKQRIEQGARKFLFSYGYAGSFIGWAEKNKIEYMSPQFKRLFKEVLTRLVTEWRQAGLTYDDFVLQSIDEAHGRQVQQVLDTTPLIREVDPKVRIGMTIMASLTELRRMAPHVDVWLNRNGGVWGDEQAKFFADQRAKGKPIWSWNMPNNPRSKPLTQFRTYGWRAMKFDFDAIGFFLYFGLVYQPQRAGGGIATRHWEAWRDGVEDYQLLGVLRDEIDRAAQRGLAGPALAGARKQLAACVDDVIGESFFPDNTQETHDRIEAARAKVAAEISRVRKLSK